MTGNATPEEIAAVLAVLAAGVHPREETAYERWRSVRVRAVSSAARQP